MGKVTVVGGKVGIEAPSGGIALSTLAEGSIVKLNENGSPVAFYVAKHDYESGLNGTGRTLLVRKNCYTNMAWNNNSSYNTYADSSIDTWLNGSYKALLDSSLVNAIETTTFYYTPGNTNMSVSTLSRSVFLLSATEYGSSNANFHNVEGRTLPIAANILSSNNNNGTACSHWTRSPYTADALQAIYFQSNPSFGNGLSATRVGYGADVTYTRPCFTLPATALFDEETMTFKGVA